MEATAERLPATLELVFFALFAAVVVGGILGFARARARAPALRNVVAAPQLLFRATPLFVVALFLQLLFAVTRTLPTGGIASADGFAFGDRFTHLIVPVIWLALPFGAWSSVIFYDCLRAPHDGPRSTLRTVIVPIATTISSVGPALLAASFIVEAMYAWPGIGRLFFRGLSDFNLSLVAGCLLAYAACIALLKLCAALALRIGGWTSPPASASPQTSARPARRLSAIGIVALAVLIVAAFAGLTASAIAPANPNFIDQAHWQGYPLAPGVAGHLLGTDENGRDLLSRLLFALRTSLGITALASVLAIALGALVAKATNAVPWLDGRRALSTIGIRPFAALPFILAAIAVLAQTRGSVALRPISLALIVAVVSWPAVVPAFRRLSAATLGGVADITASALLLEVTLSATRFGVQPPAPSLGNMLSNAQSNLIIAAWVVIVPTVAIVVLLGALYALGDELRDRAGPAC